MDISTNLESNLEPQVTPREIVNITRAQLRTVDLYLEHTENSAGHEALFEDCLKHFYELAAPQLPEWVIHKRLFADGEETTLHGVLSAIDTELAAWQRGGLVQSQVAPLYDFSGVLTDLQYAILAEEDLDIELRRRLERQLYGSH